jgi:hypothetical protein
MQKWPAEPKLEKRRLVGRLGFAHLAVRQHFSPVKSRDSTIKVCNPWIAFGKRWPSARIDAKAELNHRSQVCEVLAGTGIRVA